MPESEFKSEDSSKVVFPNATGSPDSFRVIASMRCRRGEALESFPAVCQFANLITRPADLFPGLLGYAPSSTHTASESASSLEPVDAGSGMLAAIVFLEQQQHFERRTDFTSAEDFVSRARKNNLSVANPGLCGAASNTLAMFFFGIHLIV